MRQRCFARSYSCPLRNAQILRCAQDDTGKKPVIQSKAKDLLDLFRASIGAAAKDGVPAGMDRALFGFEAAPLFPIADHSRLDSVSGLTA